MTPRRSISQEMLLLILTAYAMMGGTRKSAENFAGPERLWKKGGVAMLCNAINSTVETFTLIMLACLLAALVCERNGIRRDALFFGVIGCHAISTAGDLMAWRFAGKAGALAGTMARFGNILTYFFIPVVSLGFLSLLFLYKTQRRRFRTAAGRALAVAIFSVSVLSLLTLLTNPWTGWLYRIDENNIFYWGTASSFLPDGAVLIQLLLFGPLIAVETRGRRTGRQWRTLLCCAVPMAAIILEAFGVGLMLLYPSMATSLLLLYFGRQETFAEQLLRQQLELSDSRTKLLLAQIQPHFIFNSLLAIQQLCESDPQRAAQAVGDFAEYLRANLDAISDSRLISFSQELEHIQCYLALETMDPASKIRAEFRLDETDFYLPPLTVQPLVENAVRHGLKTKPEGGVVTVAAWEAPEGWYVTVTDNGAGFSAATQQQKRRRSIGMENVRARLAALCGGTLRVETGAGGTTATVFIPRQSNQTAEDTTP